MPSKLIKRTPVPWSLDYADHEVPSPHRVIALLSKQDCTAREICDVLDLPPDRIAVTLGIMLEVGQIERIPGRGATHYRLAEAA